MAAMIAAIALVAWLTCAGISVYGIAKGIPPSPWWVLVLELLMAAGALVDLLGAAR